MNTEVLVLWIVTSLLTKICGGQFMFGQTTPQPEPESEPEPEPQPQPETSDSGGSQLQTISSIFSGSDFTFLGLIQVQPSAAETATVPVYVLPDSPIDSQVSLEPPTTSILNPINQQVIPSNGEPLNALPYLHPNSLPVQEDSGQIPKIEELYQIPLLERGTDPDLVENVDSPKSHISSTPVPTVVDIPLVQDVKSEEQSKVESPQNPLLPISNQWHRPLVPFTSYPYYVLPVYLKNAQPSITIESFLALQQQLLSNQWHTLHRFSPSKNQVGIPQNVRSLPQVKSQFQLPLLIRRK